jgi:hypothetical protein
MNALLTIAASEVKTLFKERIFFLLLAVFICMTVASTFIGWSTLTTTHAIYNASVIFLHQQGVTQIPLNPVSSFPALSSFRNIIVYMFLIGSLMAIVDCKEEIIIKRVTKRSKISLDILKSILLAQMPREKQITRADDVLVNNGSKVNLKKQVYSLFLFYNKLYGKAI